MAKAALLAMLLLTACTNSSRGAQNPSAAPTPSTGSNTTTSTTHETPSTSTPASGAVMANGVFVEPRPDLTPGAADPRVTPDDLSSTICVAGYTSTVRPSTAYTDTVKRERIRAYGYRDDPANFELDHLIPLELGGDPRAVANLWPEPWESKGARLVPEGYGAESKDQFENYLHRAVCAGRVSLADAQRQIRSHWIAAAESVGLPVGSSATARAAVSSSAPTSTTSVR